MSSTSTPSSGGQPAAPTPRTWQEHGRWHVQAEPGGRTWIFATRDEAMAFAAGAFTSGATPARGAKEGGDLPAKPVATRPPAGPDQGARRR